MYGTTVALPHEDSLWVAFGAGPVGTPAHPFASTVLELDRQTLRVRNLIDLAQLEMEQDPDGEGIGSNPTDVAIGHDGIPEGVTVVADRLNFPYGLARTPEGALIVTHHSAFVGEGYGTVITVQSP